MPANSSSRSTLRNRCDLSCRAVGLSLTLNRRQHPPIKPMAYSMSPLGMGGFM